MSAPALIPPSALSTLIDRYAAGESIQTLAAAFGVSRQAIRQRILKACLSGQLDKDYGDLVTAALTNRVAEAMEELEEADNMVVISRAQHRLRYETLILERRRPHLFGPKQEIQSQNLTVVVHRHEQTGTTSPSLISNTPQDEENQ